MNGRLDPLRYCVQIDSELVILADVVHQATGMISVQLTIPVDDALARLQTTAREQDMDVEHLAHLVVDRRLNFSPGESFRPTGDAADGQP